MASVEGQLLSTDYTVGGGEVDVFNISPTQKSVFQIFFDMSNMQSGDIVVLQVQAKARAADALQTVLYMPVDFDDGEVSDAPLQITVPMIIEADEPIVLTFEQTAGAVRNWPWRLADIPVKE